MIRCLRSCWRWAPALALALSTPTSAQPTSRPGLLLGGGREPAAPAESDVDPLLPTGPRRAPRFRPEGLGRVTCGQRFAVCVHAGPATSRQLAADYLAALERAGSRIVYAMGLPAPLPDPGLGPDAGLDAYLLSGSQAPSNGVEVVSDLRRTRANRSSSHCRLHAGASGIERLATVCLAEAVLVGVNAAESTQLRRAIATYLWRLTAASDAVDVQEMDDALANPHRSVLPRDRRSTSGGTSLLMEHLERRLRSGAPGWLPVALFELSRATTEAGQVQWHNEPDAVDVLRQTFAESTHGFGDFMLGFAVDRAFLGSRDREGRSPKLAWLGEAGKVRFDWLIRASTLPRRVAARRPLEPMGATYVWVDLDRGPPQGTLALRTQWEAPASFRWTVIAIDERGRQKKRYDLPPVVGATSAERTLVELPEAAGLLIVGVNLGGVDRTHPFEPDHQPWEPHGFTVYLAEI